MRGIGQATKDIQVHLPLMIDGIPALAWSCRPDGTAEFLNQQWLDYTGLSLEEALGWGWKVAIHPDDAEKLLEGWSRVLAGGRPGEVEGRFRRFDGEYRWFLFRATPVRDERGAIVRWYGTNTDIEGQKRAESLLAAEKRTLEMIAGGSSLTAILDDLCITIDAQGPGIISAILLMDPDGKKLRPAAGRRLPRGWAAAIDPLAIGPCAGSCGTAAFLKKRVIVPDIASDPLWVGIREVALANGLRAAWAQPLISKNNDVAGTFCIYYAVPRSPTKEDLELIDRASRLAAIAIDGERSRLHLSDALEQVTKSEAQLRTIVNAIPTQAWTAQPDGSLDFLSQRWLDYHGLSLQQARGWGWRNVIHPEDLAGIVEKWQAAVATGDLYEHEVRARTANGEYRWCLSRAVPVRDQKGNIIKWYGTSSDVEDRKQAEEKLRQEEHELRRAFDAIPALITILGMDIKVLYANQATLEYTGLTLEETKAEDYGNRIVHPDEFPKVRQDLRDGLSQGVPFQLEYRVRRKDGRYRWFLTRYNPLLEDSGKILRWYLTATDIDDRKQGEDRVRKENQVLREDIDRSSMFEEIVGSSATLRRVLTHVAKVAPGDSTVLILGETGTGKELIARAIHQRSQRSTRAFVRVNCAAIPPSLVAPELFGYEKGAFTGAMQRRLGRFESADGGTIFLDEVGDLPAETQIALLRVLQEREFERVGSGRPISVDVRVIAATNRDLSAAVAAGAFRQDLFYRLNVVPIHLPALRERVEDIPLLVEYLIERYSKKAGKRIKSIPRETLQLFEAYDWPGNVRELQNVVERAVVLCDGDTFNVDEAWLQRQGSASHAAAPLAAAVADRETELIEAALLESRGQVGGVLGAAARLGIPRQTLDSRITSLRIDKNRFKNR